MKSTSRAPSTRAFTGLDLNQLEGTGRRELVARFNDAPTRSYEAGEHLYNWGHDGAQVFLLLSGFVKSVRSSPVGKPCLLRIDGPGDLLGLSALCETRRTETAVAKTSVCVALMPASRLRDELNQQGLESEMYRYMAERIERQSSSLEYFVTLDSQHRLGAMLVGLARQFGRGADTQRSSQQAFTQDELAQMVGTTRSRIGHFLSTFERMGMVRRDKRVGWLELDVPRMEAFLST